MYVRWVFFSREVRRQMRNEAVGRAAICICGYRRSDRAYYDRTLERLRFSVRRGYPERRALLFP